MMKSSFLVLAIALVVIACQRKSTPNVSDRTDLPVAPAAPVATAADIQAGQVIYTTSCSRCHKTKPVENWTVDQWNGILKSMIPKAKLDTIQAGQVTAYVHSNAKKL